MNSVLVNEIAQALEPSRRPAKPKFTPSRNSTQKFRNLLDDCGGNLKRAARAVRDDWSVLYEDALRQDRVRNENTFSTALTTNYLILEATTQTSPKFASLLACSRAVSPDPLKAGSSVVVKYNTTAMNGSTTLVNPTSFQTGDSTLNAVSIPVNLYSEPFHITNTQLNDGLRMEDLVVAKMADLGSKISQVLVANITAATYVVTTPIISSPLVFNSSDLSSAWKQIKKGTKKNLFIDGTYLSNVINDAVLVQCDPVIPGTSWRNVFGWDYISLHTEWSTAGNNIIGFACSPEALGVVGGPTTQIDSEDFYHGNITQSSGILPGIELPITASMWFDLPTRTYWASLDMAFGAAPMDTTAGVVIASGMPS